jgi:TolB-like protein/DNA-binding winged helix-turn-helix (wHTH) protein/tetratricopeptide (TPR) repeat protein
MPLAGQPSHQIRFGEFTLDLETAELRNNGHRSTLQGQPFQILLILLEQPGVLVTRDELKKRLWPSDTFVDFDHGLNKAVNRLREALDDSADHPKFIETLPRRGYRFIGRVEAVVERSFKRAEESAPQDIKVVPTGYAPRKIVAVVLGTAVIVLAGLMVWIEGRSGAKIQSIAVLPLENLSGDAAQDYFTDGMTDELIIELGQISQLRVISRTSVMHYKGMHKPLPQIAHELNVDAIVEGTVTRSGERVRITAQLVQASSEKQLWAKSYERELRDVFGLQNEIAIVITKQVQKTLRPQVLTTVESQRPFSPAAQESYWKGEYFLDKLTPESVRKAADYFQDAIAKEPNYVAAYNKLAGSYQILGNIGALPQKEAQSKSKLVIEKAFALDPLSGATHAQRGWDALLHDLDFSMAGAEFKRAVELNPNGVEGHQGLGEYYAAVGDLDQAVVEAERARELDPLSLIVNFNVCRILYFARRFDEALAHCKANLELDPEHQRPLWRIGAIYAARGEEAEATSFFVRAFERSESSPAELAAVKKGAQEFGLGGMWKASLQFLSGDDEKADPFAVATAYTYAGDKDKALYWLDRAYQERSFGIASLPVDPAYDSLRADRRFQDLLRRMRFPGT